MNAKTWGELDHSWLFKQVIVRWEDGGEPLADGRPSGMPHEWRGRICYDGYYYYLSSHPVEAAPPDNAALWVEQITSGFPAHALVQEVP
jgi:hypothetical protein